MKREDYHSSPSILTFIKVHKGNAVLGWLRIPISKLVHLMKASDVNQQKS